MKIFVDFDDTLAKSSEVVVEYLNQRYGLNKTIEDVHDWCYRSVYKQMTPTLVEAIYSGDYFWNNIRLFDKAVGVLAEHEVYLCTCGSDANLGRKSAFLKERRLPYKEAFVKTADGKFGKDKCMYDMAGAIQIDDRVDALLYTNAAVKILFKNGNDYTWQKLPKHTNILVVNTWDEIEEIVRWYSDNQDFSSC